MSSRESRAIVRGSARRRSSKSRDPPKMSDLRIVLLGKSVSENSRVGNFILGRAAFDSEAPPDVVERVGGRLKDRHLMIINSPQLLQTYISDHQITHTVRECVFLSDPGPHVIVLLFRHEQCSAEDQERVEKVLLSFSEQVYQHTMVLSTQEPTETSDILQNIIQKCANRHFRLQRSSSPDDLLQMFEDIVKMNDGHHLECAEAAQCFTVKQQTTGRLSMRTSKADVNLVLCGNNAFLKASISKCLRGGTGPFTSHQCEFSSECVRRDVELHGRLINLLELPALTRLSEEDVMRQTVNCVSLCDPGVHVFLLIVPDAPLTDEDKEEIEKIQKIFDSREHFMVIFTTELTVKEPVTDLIKSSPECQRLISLCGGQYRVMGLNEPENSRQIPELLDYIENTKSEPYSLQMYVKAQENRVRRKTVDEYKEELKRMEYKIKELLHSVGAECEDDLKRLRIVLIGRTGNGKSATGNTILGREEFKSQSSMDSVTTVCMKGVGEVDGRSVAVVDTPGLFDTSLSNEQAVEEIMKCVSLSSPGPHVFVIVLSVGRFTKEEADTVDLIKKIFGPKSAQFSFILFTRGDELKGESVEDYVKRSKSAELKKLIRDCGNRFLAFNNREKQDKTQVIQLLNMIEEVKNSNQGRYFTNSMFEEAEMAIKKRMEIIMKENKKDTYKVIYDRVMEDMMKRFGELFSKKLEKLRKDFEEKEKKDKKKQEIENQKRSEEEKQRKAKYHQKIEEMKREIENQRSQYEKQQKEREQEDRKREEKYRQDQEKIRNEQEHVITELKMKQEEEIKKRESELKRRNEEEEEERERWRRKIKEAENDRKETQEEIKRQQREWEYEKKRQMREQEEEERKRKEKHEEQLREKQEELEKMRKRFEREREEEQQKIEEERQKQKREREEKEREYDERRHEMERHYDRLERERKEESERRKREDERREEERKRWKEMIEDLKQEQEEEMKRREREEKKRKEREEKERNEMKQKHEEEIKEMKKKHENEAKKQAEEFNESTVRKVKHVLELTEMIKEHQEQH